MRYKQYDTDADKAVVYADRVRLAEEKNKSWHAEVTQAIKRYESAKTVPGQQSASGHRIAAPLATSVIDSQFAAMTAVEVDVVVTAGPGATEDQAYVASGALSAEWDRCKVANRTNKSVKDSLLAGFGWAKVGYDYYAEESEVPRKQADVLADIDTLIQEAAEAGNDLSTEEISRSVPLTQVMEVALSDRIVVDYVPWDALLVDPDAKNIEDVRWMCQKTYMTPEEVREDPTFREYVSRTRGGLRQLDDLKADSVIDTTVEPGIRFNRPEEEMEKVAIYVMYDGETGTVCTFQKDAGYLLNETANPYAINDDTEDKFPFVPLILRDTPSRLRGVSEMEVLEATLAELDLYHSRLATYLERMAPKVISKSRAFTPAGIEAMKSQEYGANVELNEGFEPGTDIVPFTPPQLPSEVYQVPDKLEAAGKEATGTNELTRGMFPDRRRTATETAEVVSASASRQAEKRTQLETFYKGIARRMLQLMQMFYEQEKVVKLVDEAGDFDWTFEPDDIVFAYNLEVSLTPKESKSWQSRKDDALARLNILGPLAQPGPDGSSPIDITELLRDTLVEMNTPRRTIAKILNLPEEKQQQAMEALQTQAAQANAGAGLPRADMVPGPMDPKALAAAANTGGLPPEVVAGAQGITPSSPEAAELVSEQLGQPNI